MAHTETTREQRKHLRDEERPTAAELAEMERLRPRCRADCVDAPRPCPWVSCRYHLGIDVKEKGGIIYNFEDPVGDGEHPTCALDIADASAITLESVGGLFETSREWIRQIEEKALVKLNVKIRKLDPYMEEK